MNGHTSRRHLTFYKVPISKAISKFSGRKSQPLFALENTYNTHEVISYKLSYLSVY